MFKGLYRYAIHCFSLLLAFSCSPKVTLNVKSSLPPIDYRELIYVLPLDKTIPESSTQLGNVRVDGSESGPVCDFKSVLQHLKLEARKAGGNAIKIIDYNQPGSDGNKCHELEAIILKLTNDQYQGLKTTQNHENNGQIAIHFYRFSGKGNSDEFEVFVNDKLGDTLKKNSKFTVMSAAHEPTLIWAKSKWKYNLNLPKKPAGKYYVRCSLKQGLISYKPVFELVENPVGKLEFELLKADEQ